MTDREKGTWREVAEALYETWLDDERSVCCKIVQRGPRENG